MPHCANDIYSKQEWYVAVPLRLGRYSTRCGADVVVASSVVVLKLLVQIKLQQQQQQPILADVFSPVSIISRLAYRKGVDLLVATAPRVCELYPKVRFIIGKPLYI